MGMLNKIPKSSRLLSLSLGGSFASLSREWDLFLSTKLIEKAFMINLLICSLECFLLHAVQELLIGCVSKEINPAIHARIL